MAAVVFLAFAFLICKVKSQIYGSAPFFPGPRGLDSGLSTADICGPCGPYGLDPYGPIPGSLQNLAAITPSCAPVSFGQPIINNIGAPPFIPNQIPPCPCPYPIAPCPQLNVPQVAPSVISTTVPQCVGTPVVATTVIDNTLANSLANAIQLLIVSNLVENTLGSPGGCNSLAQSVGLLDVPCVSNFEVVSSDFYPSAQVLTCEYPVNYNPCTNEIPGNFEPTLYQPPCFDAPCVTNVGTNFGPNIGSTFVPNIGPNYGSPFPCMDNNFFGFDSCAPPVFGIDSCSSPFGSPVVPSYGYDPAVATIAPMAVEVPFPASIPAQLTCNFGYIPTNVPCVSVNVEPLPFDGCNFFGNFGNGFNY